ncbi:ATP-grasp domain-containing protein [Enterobacter ludwigii]|uniref:ATP-grasp domain-containing protein n=1 Tax=Enterobacter ludwigii TaxID=299767 RepID=G8LHX2_9ENTR|nr:ATP-grasp domain-containing protein [Enterobacter ludwigii]AEW74296.1 hypothetical protein EcWSU1_02865 [Enterobacter ludwigii]MDR6399658.1 hypothetical protein [Enterobacter ludwigii]WPL51637.1 ATP-grasp domain-containing protein [Enterobacter ludwigii]CZU90997.1 carbamoyl phosphate synthase-like protein [Enterobacter ludwigii]HDT3269049.1 ATP-grasp domain-containing protein [Enterobacter ludwigii]
MMKLNILVFPCGSENAGEIAHSLRYSLHVNRLIGASSVEDHGRFHFQDYISDVPFIHSPDYEDYFVDLIATYNIDVVFATHDSVVEKLAKLAHKHGFHLVNGDLRTTHIARYKSLTYRLFANMPWVPEIWGIDEQPTRWPVVVKPDCGQGGNGVAIAENPSQLAKHVEDIELPVVVEYLPGKELTVDCFTDRNGKIVWVSPRTRERVRAGIAMRSCLLPPNEEITNIAEHINRNLTLRGPWFFQLKEDIAQKWKLLEISCRIAGTMVAQRAHGINLPLMTLHDFMGRDVVPLPEPHVKLIDRSIKTRAHTELYWQRVYVDMDDTLIINGLANPSLLAFIYQCRMKGNTIHLITRHDADPVKTLDNAAISPYLFDEIIHVKSSEKKSQYITGPAVFIDNYFPERVDVAQYKDVLVMDVDAVEFYIE